MRFSTGSSSSSLASDSLSRKSTLCIYTEGDTPATLCEKMDSGSEAMELRRELDTVKSALQLQSESVLKQRHQLVEAGHKLAARDLRADRERRLRQDQLALVIRSLVLLESRLSREQKQIHVALQQKEKIIKIQQEEISKLRARKLYCTGCRQMLGFTSEQTNIETDPEFQSLESTDSRYQNGFARSCSYHERNVPPIFQKNTRLSKSFQLPKNDVVYGNTSSSEEGNASIAVTGTYIKNKQAFVRKDVTRRSRKFSGRKHNSAYLDSMKKKNSSQANSSSAEECMGMSYRVNQEDDVSVNHIANERKASQRIDQLIEDNTNKREAIGNDDKRFAYKIENLHGIKRQVSDEINANRTMFLNNVLNEEAPSEKPWYVNVSDPEPEIENNYTTRGKLNIKSKSADNLLTAAFDDGILNAEVISAKNEILCNSLKKAKRDKFGQIQNYNVKDRSPGATRQEFVGELNENWYASASDGDDGPSCEIYKNNPVLECVNQILLQNSLDESSNETSKSSDAPSPKASTKRVQFSTLNSISFDDTPADNGQSHTLPRPSNHDRRSNKIVKFSLETASEHSYEVPNTAQGFHYEIQSIYSNDYEPIVTKTQESHRPVPLPRTVTTNFNTMNQTPIIKGSVVKNIAANIENRTNTFHMSEKDSVPMKIVNKRKVPRTPPALPPKPKNLVSKFKFEKDSTAVHPPTETNSEAVAANQRIADVKTRKVGQVAIVSSAVEPDYCSISEINVPVVSNGKRELLLSQPTVEIHSEQYPSQPIAKNSVARVVSLQRIQSKISEQDIPMLPQVTEIIIPDEDDPKLNSNTVASPSIGGCDTFMLSNLINQTPPKLEQRNSIQIGNSVSSILSEINRGAKNPEKFVVLTELDNKYTRSSTDAPQNINNKPHDKKKSDLFDEIDRFDLSQNFEEFKIDECDMGSIVAEEYRISSSSSDGAGSDVATEDVTKAVSNLVDPYPITKIEKIVSDNYRIEIIPNNKLPKQIEIDLKNDASATRDYKNCSKLSNKPDLLSNIENLETESVRNSDIESSNSSGSNSGSYNTVKCEPATCVRINDSNIARKNNISFDFFLESSGLSSKSIATTKTFTGLPPPRPQAANHKNILRPRDIKMRVKNQLTTNKINEKPMTTAIKYFEPYL